MAERVTIVGGCCVVKLVDCLFVEVKPNMKQGREGLINRKGEHLGEMTGESRKSDGVSKPESEWKGGL